MALKQQDVLGNFEHGLFDLGKIISNVFPQLSKEKRFAFAAIDTTAFNIVGNCNSNIVSVALIHRESGEIRATYYSDSQLQKARFAFVYEFGDGLKYMAEFDKKKIVSLNPIDSLIFDGLMDDLDVE